MVRQAGKAVKIMGKPAVLLLDVCFFSKTTLTAADTPARTARRSFWLLSGPNSVPLPIGNQRNRPGKGGEETDIRKEGNYFGIVKEKRKIFIKTHFRCKGCIFLPSPFVAG
jgi:hypothetical protein